MFFYKAAGLFRLFFGAMLKSKQKMLNKPREEGNPQHERRKTEKIDIEPKGQNYDLFEVCKKVV